DALPAFNIIPEHEVCTVGADQLAVLGEQTERHLALDLSHFPRPHAKLEHLRVASLGFAVVTHAVDCDGLVPVLARLGEDGHGTSLPAPSSGASRRSSGFMRPSFMLWRMEWPI